MNMFKSAGVESVEEYLAAVPEDRSEAINFIHGFIQKTCPELKVYFAYNMIGYGEFEYTDYKKRQAKWPIVALANQKNYISIYVCAVKDGKYLAEKYSDDLGKVSTGKSCIRFKKLEDLNLEVLKKLLVEAEASPGLVGSK